MFSCKETNKNTRNNDIEDISITSKTREIALDEIIKKNTYIKLETTDSNFIGIISKIIFTPENIIIGDNHIANSVYMFDLKGRFIKKIGNKGNGPGEFSTFDHIILTEDKKSIAIIDGNKSKIIFYDLNGNFINSKSLPYRSEIAEYLDKDHFVFSNTPGIYDGSTNMNNTLLISDKSGKIINSHFPTTFTNNFNLVAHGDRLKKIKNNIYYNPNLSDTIFQISKKDIKSKYVINVEKLNKPGLENPDMATYIDFIKTKSSFNGAYVEVDNFLFLGMFPNGASPIIYDKKNRSTIKTSKLSENILFHFWGEDEIISSYKDSILVTSINPEKILKIYNQKTDDEKHELQDLIQNLNEESNPVIFLYTLK